MIAQVVPGSKEVCPDSTLLRLVVMEIIEELEPQHRGIYTGCLGYMNFNGDMDFNILIRTILASQEELSFKVGSGIVADSKPEEEYEETLVKAQAMISCLKYIFSHQRHFQDV